MAQKSGRRSASDVREEVSRLTAARNALDAEQAERRRREDAAFARYAQATGRATTIASERDGELARLDAERVRAQERAAERLVEVEAEQAAVLAELNSDGRSADDLAAMFGLPVKRVRTMLRAAKDSTITDSGRAPDTARPAAVTASGASDGAAVPGRSPDSSAAAAPGTGHWPGTPVSEDSAGAGPDSAEAAAQVH